MFGKKRVCIKTGSLSASSKLRFAHLLYLVFSSRVPIRLPFASPLSAFSGCPAAANVLKMAAVGLLVGRYPRPVRKVQRQLVLY